MRLYVSHVDSDQQFASELRDALENLGLETWDPERDLSPGANWLIEAGRALEESDGIIFVLSDEALRSSSIQKMIDYVLSEARFAGRVFVVLMNDDARVPWGLREVALIQASTTRASTVAKKIAATFQKPARLPEIMLSLPHSLPRAVMKRRAVSEKVAKPAPSAPKVTARSRAKA